MNVETIRGLVRPVVTILVVLALVAILVYLVVKFADLDMAKTFAAAFIGLIGPIIGFWFGQRTTTNGGQ